MKSLLLAVVVALAVLCGGRANAEEPTLHNTEIYVSPWAGEKPGKGTFSVRHEGVGEPPKQGYFKKHEPGEVAEFHLFVPDGLDAKETYPLLIVYHGGKDGASGKGMCRSFAKVSTERHPVIVLSPNMYTMDAMNELLAEGELPIDRRRVVVYGHSSGGMGVLSAMQEYGRAGGDFVPAALISSSTTASMGAKAKYPPCPYFVLAGEKETPAFVTNEILRERRRTCRVHALTMQQVFEDVRYVEIKDSGHAGGTPAHKAIVQHALAVSERAAAPVSAQSEDPAHADLISAARRGDWSRVHAALARLEGAGSERLRGSILRSLEDWFGAEVAAIAALTPKSTYVDRDRAFLRHGRCRSVAQIFADTSVADPLARSLASLDDAKHWQAELAAQKAYRAIVAERPGPEMKTKLTELRVSSPGTEYGRNRTREKLLALAEIQEEPARSPGPRIINPYYPNSMWRVWRDDAAPVDGVTTIINEGKGKGKQAATITLQPFPEAERLYPTGPLEGDAPVKWQRLDKPPDRFSGVWDDVYASWSGLHGYIRPVWHATDGSDVRLRHTAGDQFMHFVEARKTSDLLRCGVNFVHQSTTGMAHTITNGYGVQMTTTYERIYFSDCLVTAPAHASFTEDWPDRTKDLYLALVPTLFNSVGSSNSETLAITKMMIVGGYLPPESKRVLKLNGLYPAALLYMWKASLPYDVPYDHELRHRVAYRSLGRKDQFAGKYGHAGGERGNLSLDFHRYDEIAHMRSMIAMAQSMTVLPPEAILDGIEVAGGTEVYALKKAALVLQEPGQDVRIKLSTSASYDLQGRPVTVRWKLLYGNHATTCEPGAKPGTWTIHVPWDGSLPEGRTALALVAENGVHDSNPAVVNVFRKFQKEIPPNGGSGGKGGGYKYVSPTANRRPVLHDLQDVLVKPGKVCRIPLRAIDPEGQPVRFHKRAGEPGQLDGNLFTFKVPKKGAGPHTVTFIASDGTAGNSYAAKQIQFAVKPGVHAHITSEALVGPAPFTVKVSSKGSRAAKGKLEFGWEFYPPAPKRKAAAWKEMAHGEAATHTFAKPGLYEVALTARRGKDTDRETVQVWVTDGDPAGPVGGVVVEGNGVRITAGDETPSAFDHTHFGSASEAAPVTRVFELFNRGAEVLACPLETVTTGGEHAADFRVVRAPRKTIEPGGYGTFAVEFKPRGDGRRSALVTVKAGGVTTTFRVAGEPLPGK